MIEGFLKTEQLTTKPSNYEVARKRSKMPQVLIFSQLKFDYAHHLLLKSINTYKYNNNPVLIKWKNTDPTLLTHFFLSMNAFCKIVSESVLTLKTPES